MSGGAEPGVGARTKNGRDLEGWDWLGGGLRAGLPEGRGEESGLRRGGAPGWIERDGEVEWS